MNTEALKKLESAIGLKVGTIESVINSNEENPVDVEALANKFLTDKESLILSKNKVDTKKIGDEAIDKFKQAEKKRIAKRLNLVSEFSDSEIKETAYDDFLNGLAAKIDSKVTSIKEGTETQHIEAANKWRTEYETLKETTASQIVQLQGELGKKDQQFDDFKKEWNTNEFLNSKYSTLKVAAPYKNDLFKESIMGKLKQLNIDPKDGRITKKNGDPVTLDNDSQRVISNVDEYIEVLDHEYKFLEKSHAGKQPTGFTTIGSNTVASSTMSDNARKMYEQEIANQKRRQRN